MEEGRIHIKIIKYKKWNGNANTSILLNKYKDIKMSSIELLVEAVSESNENDRKYFLELNLFF